MARSHFQLLGEQSGIRGCELCQRLAQVPVSERRRRRYDELDIGVHGLKQLHHVASLAHCQLAVARAHDDAHAKGASAADGT